MKEYCSGGDLFASLRDATRHRTVPIEQNFRQILSAVDHCHSVDVTFHGIPLSGILLHHENIKIGCFDHAS